MLKHCTNTVFLKRMLLALVVVANVVFIYHYHRTLKSIGDRKEELKNHMTNLAAMLEKFESKYHVTGELDAIRAKMKNVLESVDSSYKLKISYLTVNKNSDICQETYKYKNLAGDYPFFYKGFEMENCTGVPDFHTLITLLFNFVHYTKGDIARVPALLMNVYKTYPKLRVILALPEGFILETNKLHDVRVLKFKYQELDTVIWNALIHHVDTVYMYVGRHVVHFSWFSRLERLVREVNNVNSFFVSGASRAFRSGQWSNGCEQMRVMNYTLAFAHGYYQSIEECLICHHTRAPFVTKKEYLPQLDVTLPEEASFLSWFLSNTQSGRIGVVCPDSMDFVSDTRWIQSTNRSTWLGFMKNNEIENIHFSDGREVEVSCEELGMTGRCDDPGRKGLALRLCCMKKLINMKKLVLDACQANKLLCELQEGSLLGAMKFSGLLPWEVDGDITLHVDNFTAFGDLLSDNFSKSGYNLVKNADKKYYTLYAKDFSQWFVEVFTQGDTDTARLSRDGVSGTRVLFNGQYVPAPASPGLVARNRYGREIYKHVLHWRHQGGSSSWNFYSSGKFMPCPKPGHHACLDNYYPDGNFQFMKPVYENF